MKIEVHGSHEKGFLAALENNGTLPPFDFDIKRVFYIFGVPERGKRGGHAHREGDQFFLCLAGQVDIERLWYGGLVSLQQRRGITTLNPPSSNQHFGLLVPAGQWVDIEITAPNTILLCLCSNYYDEADYIRDRDEWIREFSKSGS